MSEELQRYEPQEPESNAVVPYHPLPPPSLFGTADPVEVVARATRVAAALKEVIKTQGLISKISGKEYPRCEAWTLLGTMLGVFPVLCWSRAVEGGWEARVEARTRDGSVVGAAEAQCLKTERNWINRDDFALRSMAQTRATAKALRMPLGFVMTLGGFQPTPAEEMDFEQSKPQQQAKTSSRGTSNVPHSKSPPATPKPAGAASPSATPATATEEQRLRWIAELKRRGEYALGYCYDKSWLLPESGPDDDRTPAEPIESLEARHVPTSRRQADAILAELDSLLPDGFVLLPHHPNEAPQKPAAAPQKPVRNSEPDQQAWYNAIVPVPYAGMKRNEYLKKPDTIGELYNLRHDDDQARKRLFGFLYNFEPKGWTNNQGRQMPPGDSDIKFRKDLDAFGEWFEANHPDEVKD